GEFWDLNGWKHTIGRRIHADDVQEWPRTICAAWRWYGEDEVNFASEWDIGGHQEFMRKLWDVYSDADVTVDHNMQSFDGPMIASGWAEIGRASCRERGEGPGSDVAGKAKTIERRQQ